MLNARTTVSLQGCMGNDCCFSCLLPAASSFYVSNQNEFILFGLVFSIYILFWDVYISLLAFFLLLY